MTDHEARPLPLQVRLFTRETLGSFLIRLASANSLQAVRLLDLLAVPAPGLLHHATDDLPGWTASATHRLAVFSRRGTAELAAAIPALAGRPAAATRLMRACPRCAAAKGITDMVIINGLPDQYLCIRHRLWHHGPDDVDLAAVPDIIIAQRRYERRVPSAAGPDTAQAHRRAAAIVADWTRDDHPQLTNRWLERRYRLTGARQAAGPHATVIATHPEMLTIALRLIKAPDIPITPADVLATPTEKARFIETVSPETSQ